MDVVNGSPHHFPGGKRFAFTVVDDTDYASVDNLRPIYDLLLDAGMRTTKTVWPLDGGGAVPGATLSDSVYRSFIRSLQSAGVEIALHNVQNSSALRERITNGLDEMANVLGVAPTLHANHEDNFDNLYWGGARLSSRLVRALYRVSTGSRPVRSFGHVEGSPFFWGDVSVRTLRYVRNFVYPEINLDRINPAMPYHDPTKPWVARWFSSCDGEDVERFCRLISEANQDRLEREGGVCIVYTHFAYGFYERGRHHERFRRLLGRLAAKPGWFVPASTLLDLLAAERGARDIGPPELRRMENTWLRERLETRYRLAAARAFRGGPARYPALASV